MSKNWVYLLAVIALPVLSTIVNYTHCDQWLLSVNHARAASMINAMRANEQFQAFIGGWVFPVFIALLLVYWLVQEDRSNIPMHFVLLPLAYIPFSIVGFTLVNAEFQVSYLYSNPLIILTFGYAYVLFWWGFVSLFEKLKMLD